MWEWLISYNRIDVELLKEAFESYTKLHFNEFGLDIHQFVSLPAISQSVAYSKFDTSSPPFYSVPRKFNEISELFRSKMRGGICMVFHRMIALNCIDADLPDAAKLSRINKPWKKLIQWDCNSLCMGSITFSII